MKETLLQNISKTRLRIEERFTALEKSLNPNLDTGRHYTELQEIPPSEASAEALPVPASPLPDLDAAEPKIDRSAEETAKLYDVIESQRTQIQNLESAFERLQGSLKVMGTERQELVNQIHSLEEQLKRPQIPPEKLEEEKSKHLQELALLKDKIGALERKRSQAARFFKRGFHSLKEKSKKAQAESPKPHAEQNLKLMAELDAAAELIAELRDELHLGTFPPSDHPSKEKQ